jgi:hypothetical protein
MTLIEKVDAICDEWWHSSNAETFYNAAVDLVAHGYSEDDAVTLLSSLYGAVSDEYGN